MDVQVYRMAFQNALHTGRRGIGSEETDHRLVADTLFAALVTQLAARFPDQVEAFINAFPRRDREGDYQPGDAPFRLSSCFPYAGQVLFFPVPMANLGTGVDKALKKVAYVSEGIFFQVLRGDTLDQVRDAIRLQGGRVWVSREEQSRLPAALQNGGDLWRDRSRPRVWVERQTNASTIFHHGEVFFRTECGLWCAMSWHDPDIRPLIETLLADLEVMGIGGLRSYGLGAFTLSDGGTLSLPDPAGPEGQCVTLSRVHPAPDDLPGFRDRRAAYRLAQVGGFMSVRGGQDVYRRTVTLVDEGAVLPASVGGCLVDISPERAPHPSWRYGIAFPVGLGNQEDRTP